MVLDPALKNLLMKTRRKSSFFGERCIKLAFLPIALSNVDMVLSKSNMNIAFEYAQLCEDKEVQEIYYTILMRAINQECYSCH